jgi:hypothetical protein
LIDMRKSRDGDPTDSVADDDYLGELRFRGYHTDGFYEGAIIRSVVNGTPGAGDMPAELIFATSADASATPTTRLTIDAAGLSTFAGGIVGSTTIQANTGFTADANDGAYIGAAGTGFSDIFLAEGAVINWDSSDVTLTQTENELALAGGNLALGANSITMSGSLGVTGTRVTKGWFTDLEVTNAIAGSVTGNAGTVTTNANLTGPVTSVGNATAIASGAIKANMLQSAAADLGAADVTIDLGNTNGAYVTNLTADGTITGTVGLAGPHNGTVGATTPSTVVGTTVQANTGFTADANDGAYLGAAGTAFSDLFLAEGGVINWDSSDATLTQTGNVVVLAGASLETSTVGTAANSVATIDGTQTLTNKTVGAGALILAEGASVQLDPAGSADDKYSGITVTGTGGATIAIGDLVTLDKDDSRWELVDISAAAAATGDARGIIGIAATTSSNGNAITVLLKGIIKTDANFPTLTIGAPVYASTTGDIVVAQPTTADYVIRVVGFALTADEIYFNPSNDYITHT